MIPKVNQNFLLSCRLFCTFTISLYFLVVCDCLWEDPKFIIDGVSDNSGWGTKFFRFNDDGITIGQAIYLLFDFSQISNWNIKFKSVAVMR